MSPALFPSESQEWGTPQALFDKLQAEFKMDLDVAANRDNCKLPNYFHSADDALTKDWAPHRCWMNPPYGRGIGEWVKKAWDESRRGALVVCLLPARTDTRWFQTYCMKVEVRFLPNRPCFERPSSGRAAPDRSQRAPFPAVVAVFHPPVGLHIFPGEIARGRVVRRAPRYIEVHATRHAGKSQWLSESARRAVFAGEHVLILLRNSRECARWRALGCFGGDNVTIQTAGIFAAAPELAAGQEYDSVLVDDMDALPAGWDAALRALAATGIDVFVARNIA